MKNLVLNFSKQIREAIEIGEKARLTQATTEIRNVMITGLGGSGIGGTMAAELLANDCSIPILVNKDYFLPSFVNANTLVIVCSYSGNTEETVQAMAMAGNKKAKIVCITSGGKIAEVAAKNKYDLILIPGGMPPRACLGYSLTQLFYVFHGLKLSGGDFRNQLKASIELLDKEESAIQQEAMQIANFLFRKIPVIYASNDYNGVATRFRQQINENSKMLCWHHVLPEMNHNELVGWAEKHEECAVIILRNKNDYSRTQARMEISMEVFHTFTDRVHEVWSKGESQLERSLYLVHLTDWVSCYLADLKKIDATEVDIINHLKGQLSKID